MPKGCRGVLKLKIGPRFSFDFMFYDLIKCVDHKLRANPMPKNKTRHNKKQS